MSCSQEVLSGKDLNEQSGENCRVPVRAQSCHYGDERLGENWVTARAQSGHEGEEQSEGGLAVYRTSYPGGSRLPNARMVSSG